MVEQRGTLRERTRQAVRHDITAVGVALFLEQGYEATTIDDIAGAVGMSQRSVFRYFPTKEHIVAGKFTRGAEDMLAALRARPADESAWHALRRMFDVIDDSDDEEIRTVQQLIFATPALLSMYLRTLHDTQRTAVEIIVERAASAGRPYAADDPTPRALVAAAFGCLVATQETSLDTTQADTTQADTTLASTLDRAMGALLPFDSSASAL